MVVSNRLLLSSNQPTIKMFVVLSLRALSRMIGDGFSRLDSKYIANHSITFVSVHSSNVIAKNAKFALLINMVSSP